MLQADARRIPLGDDSVQCVVTSPPYWGLRKYAGAQDLLWDRSICCNHDFRSNGFTREHPDRGTVGKDANGSGLISGPRTQASKIKRGEPAPLGHTCQLCGAWRGGFGLEPTIEMYVAHTLEILREIRRVLRPDGVAFWNLGDSYAGSGNGAANYPGDYPKQNSNRGTLTTKGITKRNGGDFLKPKDLCLIPERIAIAAQSDGWWVRSMIIWAKPNPMPESVTDRPTDAYEHIIMLTKSEKYFWDPEAVCEPVSKNTHLRISQDLAHQVGSFRAAGGNKTNGPMRAVIKGSTRKIAEAGLGIKNNHSFEGACVLPVINRNMRNVWHFPTQPYRGAHFATFPEELPRRCILAATSEMGCCATCGAPRMRQLESRPEGKSWNGDELKSAGVNRNENSDFAGENFFANYEPPKTIGWKPTCRCEGESVRPCLVLDPFGGSGTTARVAVSLNRRAVSMDLAYHDHATKRTREVQRRFIQV